MPTYIVNTKVRRTWRERLLSWPWKPWQASKIVSEKVTGPYPWDAKPGELAHILRPLSRDVLKPGQIVEREPKYQSARATFVQSLRDNPRPAPRMTASTPSDDLATSMLSHHVHHSAMMQPATTWPDPPASTECASTNTTTDTGCCDSSSTDSGSSCGGE
jgi:hypothetical protein